MYLLLQRHVANLVTGLLVLIDSTTTSEENTSLFPFRLLTLLDDVSIGAGSSIGEASLSGGCEGPSTILPVD